MHNPFKECALRIIKKIIFIALSLQSGLIFAAADTVFLGGPIVTVNAKNEEVQAIAVQNGKIVAVGKEAEVKK
jgi:hypothetical protein